MEPTMTTPEPSDDEQRTKPPSRAATRKLADEDIHRFVASSRQRQGLGPTITDPVVLLHVAILIGTQAAPRTQVLSIGQARAVGTARAQASLSLVVA